MTAVVVWSSVACYCLFGRVEDVEDAMTTTLYDAAGRTTAVVVTLAHRTTFGYDATGRRVFSLDAQRHRSTIVYTFTGRQILKQDDAVISSFDHQYDNVGNRTSVAEAEGSRVTWTYDGTSQLTREQRTGTASFDVTWRPAKHARV